MECLRWQAEDGNLQATRANDAVTAMLGVLRKLAACLSLLALHLLQGSVGQPGQP